MILSFVFGEARLSFAAKNKRSLFFYLSHLDIPFRNVKIEEDSFSVTVPFYRKRALLRALKREEIEPLEVRISGLPSYILRYRKRWGIPLGVLFAVLIIWLSGRVIWCVNIEGNEKVSDREIELLLAKLGCGVGDTYDSIDFDVLHNRFLMECQDIAWISVNMNGTHANVEVRETVHENAEEEEGFFNIVAKETGQIERFAATGGKPVCEIGDTVLEGELLISGAISYREDTLSRYESADGAVYARVFRSFEVNVPLEQTKKVETGSETYEKTLRFFKIDINLFRNSRIPDTFCDKITMYNQIYLFDSLPLPLYINETVMKEYTEEKVTLTEEEAREIATAQYREKLKSELSDCELLSKSVTEEFDGRCVTVRCEMYCLADIAKKVPLVITNDTENNTKETEQ